ncbi:zinc ribbon domain-containing protein [Sanguibacter suaedae]|uniref:C4-type zinc ribbon domain-containing protein n=1 Tax=Sanguibacter suaedae TaxID=2795737 RepID=A0A934IAE9_9MICO|nr:C4-type zinc ribbon domain-containing protein [Sanguibacter suaedae]MBI9114308.1 hypothetical protein [Sanguibacter suaedae]
MTTAPVEDQRRLLDVQALDTRVQQLQHKRTTLPALARLVEIDSQLADLHTALVQSRTAASDLRRELAKAESDVEQVRARATRDQTRLDSGAVGAKDAQALMSELESLTRRQGVLEEVELDVMERLEAHEDTLAKLDEAHQKVLEAKTEAEAERDAGYAEIDRELNTVQGERASLAEGLDAGLVAAYDKLRSQLGGLGAAALRGRRCEGCRLELNPTDLQAIRAAAPDEVVRCEECGRILVRPVETAAAE